MAETTASRNERLADYIADITDVSLHESAPGETGANELAGGTPLYGRATPAFTAPSAGESDLADPLTFNCPAGSTAAFYGLWKGATFLGSEALDAPVNFTNQGAYTLNSLPLKTA